MQFMFGIEQFSLFAAVSLLINLSPGPDMIYTVARTLSQGTNAGILSALGIAAGCLMHITAAVLGLSTLIENSVILFSIIKYLGAGYLIYLGLRSLIGNKKKNIPVQELPDLPGRKIFFQAMLTNILNPKVAIFFLSFLPQFIQPGSENVSRQIVFLGCWFDLQGTLVLVIIAMLTGTLKKFLKKNNSFLRYQQKLTGVILIGLGIKMMISKIKNPPTGEDYPLAILGI